MAIGKCLLSIMLPCNCFNSVRELGLKQNFRQLKTLSQTLKCESTLHNVHILESTLCT